MSAQASTEESESVIGRVDVVGVGEIGENLEANGRDDDNDIDGNDFNYLEVHENEIVDEKDAVNNYVDNEKDKADDPDIDLVENENEVPEVEVAFIENCNVANLRKLPTDSGEQIRQSVANFAPPKGYEKLPLAKKDRSVIHQLGVVVVKSGQLGNPQLEMKNLKRYYCSMSFFRLKFRLNALCAVCFPAARRH